MRARISSSLTETALTAARSSSIPAWSARSRSMLLGSPTSMAEASVATLGRGRHSPLARKSGTVRLALCASTTSPIGSPMRRSPRIARGRDENGERPLGALAKAAEAAREEARAKILEGGGRTVEQLEHRESAVRRERHERRRKVERFGCERRQLPREWIAFHE